MDIIAELHNAFKDRPNVVHYDVVKTRAIRPMVSETELNECEGRLGFTLPTLLRRFYREIGNGGDGPGNSCFLGVGLGLEESDCDLESVYFQLSQASTGEASGSSEWPGGVLPFCDWGDLLYTCVSCMNCDAPVCLYADGRLLANMINLTEFFHLWINEQPVLERWVKRFREESIINPFTKQPQVMLYREWIDESYSA